MGPALIWACPHTPGALVIPPMGLLLLIAVQVILTATGFALLWRKLDRMSGEIGRLQSQLEAQAAVAAPRQKRRAAGGSAITDVTAPAPSPMLRAARAWKLYGEAPTERRQRAATLTPETGRGLVLAILAIAPAFAFFFQGEAPAIVASGLAIAAAMMLTALRPMWRAAAWASVITAVVWALLGFVLNAAQADPASYAACLALTAGAGLAHAHVRRAAPGITMALAMATAALALGSQLGMAGAPGFAFAAIVAMAAIVGALSLRLEAMHLGAFAAAVLGLFILSGQDSAAIWFTPAATWMGALFLAIAAVRVPQMGARGLAIAGAGAFAPFGAIAALHASGHGLADAYAASAAFASLAAMLGGLIAVAASRRERGLAALRATLWVLAFAAFVSVCAAIVLAAPALIAAPAFAVVAICIVALDFRAPHAAWRAAALAAGALSTLYALGSAQLVLSEVAVWPAWALITAGVVVPSLLAGCAAFLAERAERPATAGFFELVAIALAVCAASLTTRLLFSGGATLLQEISFVEVGVHSALWLTAALAIGWRADLGATQVRSVAMHTLVVMALAAMAFAAGLWLASYWKTQMLGLGPQLRDTLGFLLPTILFFGHWAFWRERGAHTQTRLALGAAALLMAAFVTVEAVRAEGMPGWAAASVGALLFALAIVVNFAPGVVHADEQEELPELRSPERSPSTAAAPAARKAEALDA
jgi:hypothetical protein